MEFRVVLNDTFEDLVDNGRSVLLDVALQRLDLLFSVLVDRGLRVLGLRLVLFIGNHITKERLESPKRQLQGCPDH